MSQAKQGKKRKQPPVPSSPEPSSDDGGLSDTEQQQRKEKRADKSVSVGTSQSQTLTGITSKNVAHAPITTTTAGQQNGNGGANTHKMHHKYAFSPAGLAKWRYLSGVSTSTYCDCSIYPVYLEHPRSLSEFTKLKKADPGTKFGIHPMIGIGPFTVNGMILDGLGILGEVSKEKGWPGRQFFMVCGQGLLTPADEQKREYTNPATGKLMFLPAYGPLVRAACENLRQFFFDAFRKLFADNNVQAEWKERTARLVKRDLCNKKNGAWKSEGLIADDGELQDQATEFIVRDAHGNEVTNDHPEVREDMLERWLRYVKVPMVPESDQKLHWTDPRCTASKWSRKVFTAPKKKGRRTKAPNQPRAPMSNIQGGPFTDHFDFDDPDLAPGCIQFAQDNGGVYSPVTYVDNAGRPLLPSDDQPYVLGGGSLISFEMFARFYSSKDKCGAKLYWTGDIQRNSLRTAQMNSGLLNMDEEGAEEATEEEIAERRANAQEGTEEQFEMVAQM